MRLPVAGADALAPGEALAAEVGGRRLVVFNVGGRLHAVDQACPHRGGPLEAGDLDGPVVTCPWHRWRWDVTTGHCPDNPALRVGSYPVTVEAAGVFVELP